MSKPLRIFITTRILASFAAIVGFAAFPAQKIIAQQGYYKMPYNKVFELLVGLWERSDGIWYLGIANNGYHVDHAAYAFMPLYPTLIHVVHTLIPLPPILVALLISNGAFLGSLYIIHELGRQEIGEAATERALWYLALFPGSLFFLAPYTESLFLFLSAAALLAAKKKRWLIAGLAGMLLAVSRNIGIAIMAPLAIEIFRDWRASGGRLKATPPLSLLLVPISFVLWILYCKNATGDALISVHQQSQWQRNSALPWTTFWGGMTQAWNYCLSYPGGVYILEAIAVAGAAAMGIVGLLRRTISLPLGLWIWIGLLPPLLAPFEGNLLMSCYRFVAVLFPAFLVLGAIVRDESWDQALRLSFAAVYGIAVAMFTCNQNMF